MLQLSLDLKVCTYKIIVNLYTYVNKLVPPSPGLPMFDNIPEPVSVHTGRTVYLFATANTQSNFHHPTISWLSGGGPIMSSNYVKVNQSTSFYGYLSIDTKVADVTGSEVLLVATNDVGSTSKTLLFTVVGKINAL